MPKNQPQRIIDQKRTSSSVLIVSGTGGGGGGVTDHGLLTGLGDDDHPHYLTTARGDARYVPLTRQIIATNGLAGTGYLSGDVTLSLASSSAGAGLTYTLGVLAVGEGNGLTVSADAVALTTPGTLTVATSNSATGSHTHAITSSANPGAAASLLASDSNGLLRLVKLEVGTQATATPALTFWSGNSIGTNPDIEATTNMLTVAEDSMYWGIDSNASGTAAIFAWQTNARTSAGDELMRLSEAGLLTITGTGVRASQVDTAAGALTLAPVTDVTLTPGSGLVKLSANVNLQSANYASQTTGLRLTYSGQGDFRYIYTDEMHAKAFFADLEQALAGGQIITKSVATLATAFTVPGYGVARTLTVKDLPSATGMAVFESGDCVALRAFSRAAGALTIGWAYGTVTSYSDNGDGTQAWTWTRLPLANNAGGALASSTVINADSIVLDFGTSGNGYHEINAIDGAYGVNSPYAQTVTWSNTSPGYTDALTVRTRTGNLNGLFGAGAEYGLYAGDGTGTNDHYLRISDRALAFHNLDSDYYLSGTQTGHIDRDGSFWFGVSSADKRLSWDGATLSVVGSGTFTGSITASSGAIAGWSITATQIENSSAWIRLVSGVAGTARLEVANASYTDRGGGVCSRSTLTGIVFWAGKDFANIVSAPFRVTNEGALTASNATLTGSLTAGNVSINSGDAIRITSSGSYSEDRSLNWYYGTSQVGYINVYGTSVGNASMTLTAAVLLLNNSTIVSTATTVDFGDAAVEVLRIKAATATGYLRSSADANVLSWSATGVGVTGTLTVSSTLTSDAITAPSVRAASGTWYAGVGATNYLSLSSAKFTVTSTQFGGDWTAVDEYNSGVNGTWVSGLEGRAKKIGDIVWFQGNLDAINITSTEQFVTVVDLPTAYTPARSQWYPIIAYYDRGSGVTGYDIGRCHVKTDGNIDVWLPGAWNKYNSIDMSGTWSIA